MTTGKGAEQTKRDFRRPISLRASSPIWASETSLARTRERATKPRGAGSREARFACPNRGLVPNLQLSTLADVTIIKSMLTTLTNSSTIKSKLRIAPCKRTHHCWVLHVASVCTLLLHAVARSLKRVKLLSEQLPTFLLFRDRRGVAQQCWIRLHSSSNIVRATHAPR